MNRDGTGQTRLTFAPGAYHPAWSPDGKRIAFDAEVGDYGFAIHLINADGSGRVAITDGGAFDVQPTWSADGSMVIFTSDRDGGTGTYVVAIEDGRLSRRQLALNDGC